LKLITEEHGRTVLSTRAIFLLSGIALAAWAPLVPLVRSRLHLDEGALGGLLLFLGIGSVLAMPLTGALTTRIGCRTVILSGGAVIVTVLPFLAVLDTWAGMAVALAVFGAAMGTVDVAMNLQAVLVERQTGRALMSGFHGLFSLGGILGAAGMSVLLEQGVAPVYATLTVSVLGALILVFIGPMLLPYGDDSGARGPLFVLPRGQIILLGVLSLIVFLAEGAVLDWSAVYLITVSGASIGLAGLGYAVFSVAMTVGRLSGDRLRARLGEQRILGFGGVVTAAGFVVPLLDPSPYLGLLGFLLVGVGAANIVPVLFSAAGRTKVMPAGLAIASVTTVGYAGMLVGPAAIGFIAELSSLDAAFLLIAAGMLFVAFSSRLFPR